MEIKLDTNKKTHSRNKSSLQIKEKLIFGYCDGTQSPSYAKQFSIGYGDGIQSPQFGKQLQNEESFTSESASKIYQKNKIQNLQVEIKEEQEQRLTLQTALQYVIDNIEDHELLKQKVEELKKSEIFQIQNDIEEPASLILSPNKSVQTNKTYNTNFLMNSVEYFIQSGLSKYFTIAQSNYIDQKRTKQNSSTYTVFESLKICKKILKEKINKIQELQTKLNQIELQNIKKDELLQELQDKLIELQYGVNLEDKELNEKYTQRLSETHLNNKQLQIENQSLQEQFNELKKQLYVKESELNEYENLIKMQNIVQLESESEILILQVKYNQMQESEVLQKEDFKKLLELLNDQLTEMQQNYDQLSTTTNDEILQLKKENNEIIEENRQLLYFQGKKQLNYDYKAKYQDILENKVQKIYEKVDQQQLYILELEKQKQQFQNKSDLLAIEVQYQQQQIEKLQQQIEKDKNDIDEITQNMKNLQIYDLVRVQQNQKPRREQCQIIIRQNQYRQYLVQIESEASSIMINGLQIQYLKKGKSNTDFKLIYTKNGEKIEDVYESDNIQKLKSICKKIREACVISVEDQSIQQDDKIEENNEQIQIKSLLCNYTSFLRGSK